MKVWNNVSGTTNYGYDELGNRIIKNDGSTLDEYYLRDHTGREVAIYDISSNSIKQVNIYGNGLVGYVKKDNPDERFYYVKDHLGSVRMTIDENSDIVSSKDYYAYGDILRSVNFGEQDRYDFTEKERDSETGLNYFGARYYDSDIGRWLSVDPLADMYPGLSPYNYTLNNPLRLVDPDGRNPKDNNRARTAYNSYIGGMKAQFTHAVDKTFNYYIPTAADYLSIPPSIAGKWLSKNPLTAGTGFVLTGAGVALKGMSTYMKTENLYFNKSDITGDVAGGIIGLKHPVEGTFVEIVIDEMGNYLKDKDSQKANDEKINKEKEQETIRALERIKKIEEERREEEKQY